MEIYEGGSNNQKFQCIKYSLAEYRELKESIADEKRECEELNNTINSGLSEIKKMNIENSEKHHKRKQKLIDLECELTKVSAKIREISEANIKLNNLRITPTLEEQ